MKDKIVKVDSCRLCKSTDISIVSKLESTPIGDKFLKNKNEAKKLEFHNNEIVLCNNCGQVQLSEIIEPSLVYDEDYLYTTDVSIGLPEHFIKSSNEIITKFNLKKDDFVVEFGSNKGIMLKAFQNKGLKVLGIEPAQEVAKQAIDMGIETKVEFFTKELALKISKEYKKAKVIIANNVIANIPNLEEIALSIADLLDDDGVFIFETSYAVDVFEKHLIDTIYHEHISYLAVKPLKEFFKQFGLKLFDAQRIGTKGGSLRGYVKKDSYSLKISDNVKNLISIEENSGIYSRTLYEKFEQNLQDYIRTIKEHIHLLKNEGSEIICYGASVGCTTMLYHFKMIESLDCLVDDNPVKFGKYLPGTEISVIDSSEIYQKGVKHIIVLAWRYIDNIVQKHQNFLESGGVLWNLDLSTLEIKKYSYE